MIDIKTATTTELGAERDRVARAVTTPGGYVPVQYINALDAEINRRALQAQKDDQLLRDLAAPCGAAK